MLRDSAYINGGEFRFGTGFALVSIACEVYIRAGRNGYDERISYCYVVKLF